MTCSCQRGHGAHEHHFVQADLLTELEPESEVDLTLDEFSRTLVVTPASVGERSDPPET
jgi:hypothetical protein